ncbi:MAG: knotted carbamoyltransferase YgeW [Candidatus Cloacimonetes bacterium]|nr:knotted carbamoyltransferase YgeW [Candidatus Cloacimonadota bacterium]
MTLQKRVNELLEINLDNFGSDFLLTSEKSAAHIEATLLLAEIFSEMHARGKSFRIFDTGLAISIFRDNSTRTRFSFASAANALGLAVSDFDEQKSQIAYGETVRETANMISFMADAVGIRDDIFLGEGNRYMREVSAALDLGYSERTLHQRPALVNLQCDIDHPTQSMADLLKLRDFFGGATNLRGKKLAMTWAYSPSYGKPLSVPQGIISLMTRMGIDVVLAHPEGYGLIPEVTALASRQAEESGGSFAVVNSMDEAFNNADVVYPKSWAPFAVMEERTRLLKTGNNAKLKNLERQCLASNAKFTDWECTMEKMRLTKNGKALYMHCLPADISGVSCEKGEVSAEIFEKYRAHTYSEAGFKPFVIASMIALCRLENPNKFLYKIINRHKKRIE